MPRERQRQDQKTHKAIEMLWSGVLMMLDENGTEAWTPRSRNRKRFSVVPPLFLGRVFGGSGRLLVAVALGLDLVAFGSVSVASGHVFLFVGSNS